MAGGEARTVAGRRTESRRMIAQILRAYDPQPVELVLALVFLARGTWLALPWAALEPAVYGPMSAIPKGLWAAAFLAVGAMIVVGVRGGALGPLRLEPIARLLRLAGAVCALAFHVYLTVMFALVVPRSLALANVAALAAAGYWVLHRLVVTETEARAWQRR
jgi:hypothetical protein